MVLEARPAPGIGRGSAAQTTEGAAMTGSPYDPPARFGEPSGPRSIPPVIAGQIIPTDLESPVGGSAHSAPSGAYDPVNRSYAPLGPGQPPAGQSQDRALQPYTPAPTSPGPSANVYVLQAPKSVGVAFVLTFFFGPFGMFYSTVAGALILLGIGLGVSILAGIIIGLITLVTFGVGGLLVAFAPLLGIPIWITSMIWGCLAASSHNDRLRAQAQQAQQMQAQQAAPHGYHAGF